MIDLFESLALVEVCLAPDPWLVGAAHIGFHRMDPAEVPCPGYPAEERAHGDVIPGVRVVHLDTDHIPKVFSPEVDTVYVYTVLHECDKPAQDISPALIYPNVQIRHGRGYARAEDPAAEPALLTGLVFRCAFVHDSIQYSSGIWIMVPRNLWSIRCRQVRYAPGF